GFSHSSACLLRLRRSPRSSLFPYTTLFRSLKTLRCSARVDRLIWTLRSSSATRAATPIEAPRLRIRAFSAAPSVRTRADRVAKRSEEHTSELQSLAYLVCRLLLEKKKRGSV